jgi:hypothetical protein
VGETLGGAGGLRGCCDAGAHDEQSCDSVHPTVRAWHEIQWSQFSFSALDADPRKPLPTIRLAEKAQRKKASLGG